MRNAEDAKCQLGSVIPPGGVLIAAPPHAR
jgi:hypothetical protein